MKKFLLIILSVLFVNVTLFADDETSCRIPGTNAVATVNNPVTKLLDGRGETGWVQARVAITEVQEKDVNVVINVYSVGDNRLIGSDIVRIKAGSTSGKVDVTCEGEVGTLVNIRIASASCR